MGEERKRMRLSGFDYSSSGAYFITVCTFRRNCSLGAVTSDGVVLTELGELAAATWRGIPCHHPHVCVDALVVMPDHLHGILLFTDEGRTCPAPTLGLSSEDSRRASAKGGDHQSGSEAIGIT
jgi:putative transposase